MSWIGGGSAGKSVKKAVRKTRKMRNGALFSDESPWQTDQYHSTDPTNTKDGGYFLSDATRETEGRPHVAWFFAD